PCGATQALGRDRAELADRTVEPPFAPDSTAKRVEHDRGPGTADLDMAPPAGLRLADEVGSTLQRYPVQLDLLLDGHPQDVWDVPDDRGVRVVVQDPALGAVRADDARCAGALDAEVLEEGRKGGRRRGEREEPVAVCMEVSPVSPRVTGIEGAEPLAYDHLEVLRDRAAATKIGPAARFRSTCLKHDRRREGDGDERGSPHSPVFSDPACSAGS